jgi:hypothetical protein
VSRPALIFAASLIGVSFAAIFVRLALPAPPVTPPIAAPTASRLQRPISIPNGLFSGAIRSVRRIP